MAHVRETRVFLRAPGAGKTTLINCLAGERVFASRDEEGATQDFQRIVGDVAYIDTLDVVTEQTAIQMLAEVITDVLSKPRTYEVFFVVRLVSGRVVNEELMAIERLLDAIHNENLLFSVLVNNVGKRQYELLRRQDEAFEQLVVAINSGKYMASDVHIIPRFQELDEKKNEIVQLPDDTLEFIEQRAPSVVVPVGVLQSSEQVIHSVEDLQPSGKDLTEAKHRNEYSSEYEEDKTETYTDFKTAMGLLVRTRTCCFCVRKNGKAVFPTIIYPPSVRTDFQSSHCRHTGSSAESYCQSSHRLAPTASSEGILASPSPFATSLVSTTRISFVSVSATHCHHSFDAPRVATTRSMPTCLPAHVLAASPTCCLTHSLSHFPFCSLAPRSSKKLKNPPRPLPGARHHRRGSP